MRVDYSSVRDPFVDGLSPVEVGNELMTEKYIMRLKTGPTIDVFENFQKLLA